MKGCGVLTDVTHAKVNGGVLGVHCTPKTPPYSHRLRNMSD
jgi:hypothetical protein